ncbi:hypothetical protein ACFU99_11145 [Streptomyces sp. NPDC057654]|uniref:scabin-related ADP-ribosyltransferase n=1 Tax=Streptomyces sp. NPDC057654 TaxID=3346196 RepID=UPI0036936C8B
MEEPGPAPHLDESTRAAHDAAQDSLVSHYDHVLDLAETRNTHLEHLPRQVDDAARAWEARQHAGDSHRALADTDADAPKLTEADRKAVVDAVTADLQAEFKTLTEVRDSGPLTAAERDGLRDAWKAVHDEHLAGLPERFDQVDRLNRLGEKHGLGPELSKTVRDKYLTDLEARKKAAPDEIDTVGSPEERYAWAAAAEDRVGHFLEHYDAVIGKQRDGAAFDHSAGPREQWRTHAHDQLLDSFHDMKQLESRGFSHEDAAELARDSAVSRLHERLRLETDVLPQAKEKLTAAAEGRGLGPEDPLTLKAGESLAKDLRTAVEEAFTTHIHGSEPTRAGLGHAVSVSRSATGAMLHDSALYSRLRYHEELSQRTQDMRSAVERHDLLHDEESLARVADELAAKLEASAEARLGGVRTGREPLLGDELDARYRSWRESSGELIRDVRTHLDRDAYRQGAVENAGAVFERRFYDYDAFTGPAEGGFADVASGFRRDWVAVHDRFHRNGGASLDHWLETEKNTTDGFRQGTERVQRQRWDRQKLAVEKAEAEWKAEAAQREPAGGFPADETAAPHGQRPPEPSAEPRDVGARAHDDAPAQEQTTAQEHAGTKQEDGVVQEHTSADDHATAQGSHDAHDSGSSYETAGSRSEQRQTFADHVPEQSVEQRAFARFDSEIASAVPKYQPRSFLDSTAVRDLRAEFADRFTAALEREGASEADAAATAAGDLRARYAQEHDDWWAAHNARRDFRSALAEGPLVARPGVSSDGLLWEDDLAKSQPHWDTPAREWYRHQIQQLERQYIEERTAEGGTEPSAALDESFRTAALRLSDRAVPTSLVLDGFWKHSESYDFSPDTYKWSARTVHWYQDRRQDLFQELSHALEREPGALASVEREYAQRIAMLKEGARFRDDPGLIGEQSGAFVPAPSHAASDDWRVPVMRAEEQRLHEKYDGRLRQAVEDAAYDERIQESFEHWVADDGQALSEEQAELLLDRTLRLRELDPSEPLDLSAGWRDQTDLTTVREAAVEQARRAFDRAFRSWSSRLSGSGAQEPAGPLDADLVARVGDHILAAFEQKLDTAVREVFATGADTRDERLRENVRTAASRLRGLTAELTDAFDLRAFYESELARADEHVTRLAQDLADGLTAEQSRLLHALDARGHTLSEAGATVVRDELHAELDAAFTALSGFDGAAVASRGERPELLARWHSRYDAVLSRLPGRLVEQAGREAAVLRALRDVERAADTLSTRPPSPSTAFTDRFALRPQNVLPETLLSVQKSIASAVDDAFNRAFADGPSAERLPAWEAAYDEAAGQERAQALLLLHAARRSALAQADAAFAEQLARWRTQDADHILPDERNDWLRTEFADRAAKAFDAAFTGAADAPEELLGGVRAWDRRFAELVDEIPVHLDFEVDARAALNASDGIFSSLSAGRLADAAGLARLADDYRTEFFDVYRGLWAPRDLSSSWLRNVQEDAQRDVQEADASSRTADAPAGQVHDEPYETSDLEAELDWRLAQLTRDQVSVSQRPSEQEMERRRELLSADDMDTPTDGGRTVRDAVLSGSAPERSVAEQTVASRATEHPEYERYEHTFTAQSGRLTGAREEEDGKGPWTRFVTSWSSLRSTLTYQLPDPGLAIVEGGAHEQVLRDGETVPGPAPLQRTRDLTVWARQRLDGLKEQVTQLPPSLRAMGRTPRQVADEISELTGTIDQDVLPDLDQRLHALAQAGAELEFVTTEQVSDGEQGGGVWDPFDDWDPDEVPKERGPEPEPEPTPLLEPDWTHRAGTGDREADVTWFRQVRDWFLDEAERSSVRLADEHGGVTEPADETTARAYGEWRALLGEGERLGADLRAFTGERPSIRLKTSDLPDADAFPGGYAAWSERANGLADRMRELHGKFRAPADRLTRLGLTMHSRRGRAMDLSMESDAYHALQTGAFPAQGRVTAERPRHAFAAALWPVTDEHVARITVRTGEPAQGAAPLLWRADEDVLYRWDTRPPETIRANGFEARGDDFAMDSLRGYQYGGSGERPTAWVSATRSSALRMPPAKVASQDAERRMYRYTLKAPGGLDLAATLGRDAYPDMAEVLFLGGIAPRFIVHVETYGRNGDLLASEALQPSRPAPDLTSERVVTPSGADEETTLREARRLMRRIADEYGVHVDSAAGGTAVRESHPKALPAVLKQIGTRRWGPDELEGLHAALAHYAPLLGARRAASRRAGAEQEITAVGAVNWAIRGTKLFRGATGEYIASHKIFNLYALATAGKQFGGGRRAIESVAAHELAHGLLAYALPEFTQRFWEGVEQPWKKSGQSPTTNPADDFKESLKSFLLESTQFRTEAPRHAAAIAALRERRPETFERREGELTRAATERIARELKDELPWFIRQVGTWTEDGRRAFAEERPITEYGETNADEDLAETAMYYFLDRAELRANAPLRAAYLDALVGSWTEDGPEAVRRTRRAVRGTEAEATAAAQYTEAEIAQAVDAAAEHERARLDAEARQKEYDELVQERRRPGGRSRSPSRTRSPTWSGRGCPARAWSRTMSCCGRSPGRSGNRR